MTSYHHDTTASKGFGVQLYENARDNLLELIGQPLIEKGVKVKKPTQRKAATEDAVQLFTDAVLSKSAFDDVMSELEAACAAAGFNAQLIVCDVKVRQTLSHQHLSQLSRGATPPSLARKRRSVCTATSGHLSGVGSETCRLIYADNCVLRAQSPDL